MKRWTRHALALSVVLAVAAGCATDPTNRGAGAVIDDASITTRVKTALVREDDVKARQINVNTYRGVVQLSGFVDSREMAQRAEAEARRVPGVVRVQNDLLVQSRR